MGHKTKGFASMDPERHREVAAKGGRSQGKHSNPGNFAHDRARAVKAGTKGGRVKKRLIG